MSAEKPQESKIDKNHVLYEALRGQFLGRSHLVLLEAMQREKLAVEEAKAKHSYFSDRYVTDAPLATPAPRTKAIVVNATGERITAHPGEPHMFIYFDNQPGIEDIRNLPNRIWIEPVDEDGNRMKIVITHGNTYPFDEAEWDEAQLGSLERSEVVTIPDGDRGDLAIGTLPTIPYEYMRAQYDMLKASQPAPQVYGPHGA